MKIARVQPFLLSFPFADPIRLPFYGGERTIMKRDAMLIRVETDSGLTGYAPGPGSERAYDAIRNTIAPFLEGHAVGDPDALRIKFENGPGAGDHDLLTAYGSVDIALWDIVARSYGVPLSEVIGGRVRERVTVYGSAGMYQSPEKYAEEAAGIVARGFRAYKMRPGLGPDEDIRAANLVREAVGLGMDLMIDAHTWWRMGNRSYSPETVVRVAEAMADADPLWLEEPLPPSDHAGYVALKERDIVALASGEHEPAEEGFVDLIALEAVDYVQMDVCCQGGLSLARRLFSAIARQNMRFAFHSWGTELEVLVAAHLGACWPETLVEWLEYPCYSDGGKAGMYAFPIATEILKEPLPIEHSQIVVPTGPGLGIDVNEDIVQKYPWIPGPWSYFQIESPRRIEALVGDHSVPSLEVTQAQGRRA